MELSGDQHCGLLCIIIKVGDLGVYYYQASDKQEASEQASDRQVTGKWHTKTADTASMPPQLIQ